LDNYEYCVQFGVEIQKGVERNISVLDYGCGQGQIVARLRELEVEAFGCDVFYKGGDASPSVPSGMLGNVIRHVDRGTIPFPSESFDVVINNQVMEHVEDLDPVLREIHRVLRPGGKVLSLFPHRSVWREGHCGIPFLHWFPKGSRPRVYYAMSLRAMGLGYFKAGKGIHQWSADFCDWLDKWTWYRGYKEIRSAFQKYFIETQHIEDHWLEQRLQDRAFVVMWLPRSAKQIFVRTMAGLVFICSKPEVSAQ
jgi:SAM-dependent methyltransferase